MPKAVLDSSVLISAFIKPQGRVMELLRQPLRGRYQMCLSEEILSETAEVLLSKESIRHNLSTKMRMCVPIMGWLLSLASC
jgi:predicted nucleic acid-binding protein